MFYFLCTLLSAQAQVFYLEPQIRTGVGASYNDGALGISFSMDSRMTQLINVSVGAFRSTEIPELVVNQDDVNSWIALRHGIWAAPGVRFPHRYAKKGINWDLLLRTGFGVTFSELAEEEDWFLMEPSLLGGTDFIVFQNKFSLKLSGKMFFYGSYIPEFKEKSFFLRPNATIEIGYKW